MASVLCFHYVGTVAAIADSIQYVYDSANRLIEVHYPDKVVHYTYDDAGNRTGIIVEILVVAPTISALSPRGAVAGSNGLTLIISGSGFTNTSVVQWNGADRTTAFINSNEVRIDLTAADLAAAGTASVVVVNSTPTLSVSNAQPFSVVQTAALSGRVTSNGDGLGSVTIDLMGTETTSVATDANGNFNFAVLNNGSYLLTPSLENYTFTPVNRQIAYTGIAQSNLDFEAAPMPGSISGSIAYAIQTKPVPGVVLNAIGSVNTSAITDQDGNYSLTNFGSGSYTVTPSKPTQPCGTSNGIFASDASKVSQYVVGLRMFSDDQLAAANVSGLGSISSFDASLISRRVVGLCTNPTNFGGQWKFMPPNKAYGSVLTNLTGENYTAILMGDVDGDWNPAFGNRPANRPKEDPNSAQVSIPHVVSQTGSIANLPLRIDNLNGTGVVSYQFEIKYDPAVVEPAQLAVDLTGTVGDGSLSMIYNDVSPGLLKVAVYGAIPVSGDGIYANVRFVVIGTAGTSSPIAIREFRFNDVTEVTTVDGLVKISAPATELSVRR